jgi:GNAT superfamily N-acetyltransferase
MYIRKINPDSAGEIALVAQRMRDTLIEVEGSERGAALYSLEWLEERVRWHLNPAETTAQVLVATTPAGEIIGHSIFRIEASDSYPYGLISTTYVLPAWRKSGLATQFLECAHAWFRKNRISISCTWTSASNAPLIALYRKFGYEIVDHGPNDIIGTPMVKLAVHVDQFAQK